MPRMPQPNAHFSPQTLWQSEYEKRRYLRHASDAALADRYATLLKMLWSTDRDGNVQQPRDQQTRLYALKLIFHVLLEQQDRGLAPSGIAFDEKAMRTESAALYVPPKLSGQLPESPKGFSKFGPSKYIKPSYERGIFRIAPASTFLDPSLNAAQQDQELQHYSKTPNQSLKMNLHGFDNNGKPISVSPTGGELIDYMNVPDFYVWCCSWNCDIRTLYDFSYDSFIFIHNEEEFAKRMVAAVKDIKPELISKHDPVSYYDPYNIRRDQLFPIFVKNFKYRYQNEYRFAWTVPTGTTMEPFNIEIGPLNDIAHYFEKS